MKILPFFLIIFVLALFLSACGGSGRSENSNNTLSRWQPSIFEPASNFAQKCVVPTTWINPYNNLQFTDTQGTVVDENNWLRSWSNASYLWYDEIIDKDPALYTDPVAYFSLLKTEASTISGKPKDQFHFSVSLAEYETYLTAVSARYGFYFRILRHSPTTEVVILYTEPNSPAAQAGLQRGTKIMAVDGNAFDVTDLVPDGVDETHTFLVLDSGSVTPRTVVLSSAVITNTPVRHVSVFDTTAGQIGYLLFTFHAGKAEEELINAIRYFADEGIRDLVLDLRYNSGGLIDIANRLSYMLAGFDQPEQPIFYSQQFNNKSPELTSHVFSSLSSAGETLPTLNLARVFILTGASTCSASELIINGLRGIDVDVIQVGETTCGKPYGFIDQINCGRVYSSINFKSLNNNNFGDYADGFSPENSIETAGIRLAGCYVADNDYEHMLGDPQEALFAAALQYRIDGSCPTISPSSVSKKSATPEQDLLIDSKQNHPFWRNNMRPFISR